MDDTSLYLVVLVLEDAERRRKLRKILATFGTPITPDVYEVPATPRAMFRMQRSVEAELQVHDEMRIYPVCARCRDRAVAHGTSGFATVPLAWIY